MQIRQCVPKLLGKTPGHNDTNILFFSKKSAKKSKSYSSCYPSVAGRIILRWISEERRWKLWIGFVWLKIRTNFGLLWNGNDPSGSVTCQDILEKLSDWRLHGIGSSGNLCAALWSAEGESPTTSSSSLCELLPFWNVSKYPSHAWNLRDPEVSLLWPLKWPAACLP
jgi:hypothetical protein